MDYMYNPSLSRPWVKIAVQSSANEEVQEKISKN